MREKKDNEQFFSSDYMDLSVILLPGMKICLCHLGEHVEKKDLIIISTKIHKRTFSTTYTKETQYSKGTEKKNTI